MTSRYDGLITQITLPKGLDYSLMRRQLCVETYLKYSIQVFNSDFDSVYCLESMLQPGVLLLSLLQIVLMAQIDLSKSVHTRAEAVLKSCIMDIRASFIMAAHQSTFDIYSTLYGLS